MARYFARLTCHRLSGDEDLYESEFNTEQDIKQWIEKHSFTDFLSKTRVQWKILYVFDSELKEDITYKFIQTKCLFYYIIIIESKRR